MNRRIRQRLAGWVCVLTHALSLAAQAASSASLFTPLNTVCVDEVAAGGVTPRPEVTYGYDKAGKAITLTSANGQVTVNAYDAAGRLIKRELFRESGGFKQTVFDWTHDANGNVTSQTETWPGTLARTAGTRTTSMVYDWASRLLTETIVDPQEGTTTTLYAYNAANNRTSKQVIGGMLYTLRDNAGAGAHDALLL